MPRTRRGTAGGGATAPPHGRGIRGRGTGGVSLAFAALLAACSSAQVPAPAPAPPAGPADAPWAAGRLRVTAVPQAYLTAWSRAENRDGCALIAFTGAAASQGATARTATFSGGWGVAYDQPDLRSAFGVAGTGVNAGDPAYDEWPYRLRWSDGSSAGYGPEGGSGPNQLAYLTIAGQDCLYNVWSRMGRTHLEQLLESLRLVDTAGT